MCLASGDVIVAHKALIVDDSASSRFMLKSFLADSDLDIFEAVNGQEAIEIYEEIKPDVTFMDLTMPVMSGFEAIKIIKEKNPEARIIVLSADIQKNSISRINELGAFAFLKKPMQMTEILDILKIALSDK